MWPTSASELILVKDMHGAEDGDAPAKPGGVALPGGFGTMDELFELLTWKQLRLHAKPMGLLNVKGYYDGLLTQMAHMRQEGFLHDDTQVLAHAEVDAPDDDDLLGRIIVRV